jgi:hypothetical protein
MKPPGTHGVRGAGQDGYISGDEEPPLVFDFADSLGSIVARSRRIPWRKEIVRIGMLKTKCGPTLTVGHEARAKSFAR